MPFANLTLRTLFPVMPPAHPQEALRAAIGAVLGLVVTDAVLWLIASLTGATDAGLLAHPLLIAPFGASAVLIYAVPTSPLAQPWSVVAGNTIAALCALVVLQSGLPPMVTLGLAVLLASVAMAFARALHPPGGAVAVAMVLTATPDHGPGLSYLLTVAVGSAVLTAFGIAFNRATARHYPFQPVQTTPYSTGPEAAKPAAPEPARRHLPTPLALAAALDRLRLGANLGVDDLAQLIETAEALTASQSLALTAAQMMTAHPVSVRPEADWRALAALFVQHGFRNLPVVDPQARFLGLIPVQSLLRPGAQGLTAAHLLQEVTALVPDATLADLLPPLAQGRQTCLPILGDDGRLSGLITRSDIVAALVHAIAHP